MWEDQAIRFRPQKSILCPCLFFWHHLSIKFFFNFHPTLTANNSGLNLQNSKTTTFSESSGRQLSHGTTLYRSYLFQKNWVICVLVSLVFVFFLAFSAQSHCKSTESECLDSSIDFFAWFHIDCHRHVSKYAHFPCFTTILALSLSFLCWTKLLPSADF